MICVHRSRTISPQFQTQFAPTRQTYRSSKATFEYQKLLGQGSFAKVLLVRDQANGKQFALKIIEKSEMILYSAEENIKEEILIHYQLQHPNIIALHDIFEDENNIYLVLEYCDDGNLYQWLEKIGKFTEQSAANILTQIIQALQHLQQKYVVHRDIKPENILLTKDGTIKLCDFGWAQQARTLIKLNVIAGTTEFMPPEILLCQPHSFQVDIWSLGVLLYEMLHGDLPFRGKNIEDICTKIKTVQYQFSNSISEEAKNLIILMLQYNQNSRPSLTEILKHPFLQKFQKRVQSQTVYSGGKSYFNNGSPNYQNQNNDPQVEMKQSQQVTYIPNSLHSENLSPFSKNKLSVQYQPQQFYTVVQQPATNQQPLTPYPFNNQQLLKQSMTPPQLQAFNSSISSNSTASSQQNASLKQTIEPLQGNKLENTKYFNSLPSPLPSLQPYPLLQTTALPNSNQHPQVNYPQKQNPSQSSHILKTQVSQISNTSQVVVNSQISNTSQVVVNSAQSLKLNDSPVKRLQNVSQYPTNQQIYQINPIQNTLKPQQCNLNSPPTQKSTQLVQSNIVQISTSGLPAKRQYALQQPMQVNRYVGQVNTFQR